MSITTPAHRPLLPAASAVERKFIGPYRIVSRIKGEPGARVLLGIYYKNFWFRKCIIKEAVEDSPTAMCERLSHQYHLHRQFSAVLPIAEVLAMRHIEGFHYLILKHIPGKLLQERVDALYKDRTFSRLRKRHKALLVNWLMHTVKIVGEFHQRGLVHRDISASNFLVAKNGTLFLLDLELAYCFQSKVKSTFFCGWTAGYSSPQQIKNYRPCEKDDIYSLGGLMVLLLAHVHPKELDLRTPRNLVHFLSQHIEFADIIDLIIRCLDPDPERRPSLKKIEMQLLKYYEFKAQN